MKSVPVLNGLNSDFLLTWLSSKGMSANLLVSKTTLSSGPSQSVRQPISQAVCQSIPLHNNFDIIQRFVIPKNPWQRRKFDAHQFFETFNLWQKYMDRRLCQSKQYFLVWYKKFQPMKIDLTNLFQKEVFYWMLNQQQLMIGKILTGSN